MPTPKIVGSGNASAGHGKFPSAKSIAAKRDDDEYDDPPTPGDQGTDQRNSPYNIEFSAQDIICEIEEQLNGTIPTDAYGYSPTCYYIKFLFPDDAVSGHAIVAFIDYSGADVDKSFWDYLYKLDDDICEPVLGTPKSLAMTFVAVSADEAVMPLSLEAMRLTQAAATLLKHSKDVAERRAADNRTLSPGNNARLVETTDELSQVVESLRSA